MTGGERTAGRAPHRIVLLPGDGIGPEVTAAARHVLDATGVAVEWEVHEVGLPAVAAGSVPLPDGVLAGIRRCGVALKGPVSTPPDGSFRSVNIALRRALDLYVQARPCRSALAPPRPGPPLDVVIARETTEDLYAGVEIPAGADGSAAVADALARAGHPVPAGCGMSVKFVTEGAARRAARAVLTLARAEGRRRVTVVHKASVMRATDGLFLEAARAEAAAFPDLEFDDVLVDAAAAFLVHDPARFDVVLTGNLYGDILADLAGGLLGSIGLVPGVNVGDGVTVFEAAHGSAPRRAGLDMANPTGCVLSVALLLRHLGEAEAAWRVEDAVATVLAEGRALTYDVAARAGRTPVGTAAYADAVADRVRRG